MSNIEEKVLKKYLEDAYRAEMENAKEFIIKKNYTAAAIANAKAETYREIRNAIDKIKEKP